MGEDIVSRCRAVESDFGVWLVIREAADEIERLREWKELAYEMRNKYWWFMRAKTLRKFDAMHKSDWKRHDLLGNRRD